MYQLTKCLKKTMLNFPFIIKQFVRKYLQWHLIDFNSNASIDILKSVHPVANGKFLISITPGPIKMQYGIQSRPEISNPPRITPEKLFCSHKLWIKIFNTVWKSVFFHISPCFSEKIYAYLCQKYEPTANEVLILNFGKIIF